MKEKKEYKMLQLDAEMHKALRDYCKWHGFQMKGFVQALIRQAIRDNKKK
jgi:hypothetical protein